MSVNDAGEIYTEQEQIILLRNNVSQLGEQQQRDAKELRQAIREVAQQAEKQWERFTGEIKLISEKFSASQKTDWRLIISIATICLTMIAGGWLVIGLQIENKSLHSQIETERNQQIIDTKQTQDLETNTNRDERSEEDRKRLNERMDRVWQQNIDQDNEIKGISGSLQEIEGQFRKAYDEHNIQFAETMRNINSIKRALHDIGGKIDSPPTDPYYYPGSLPQYRPANQ